MADTLVLGASAHACGFKSRRLHQNRVCPIRGIPCFIAGGALRLLFRLVLPQGKTTGFDRTTSPKSAYSPTSGKTGVLSPASRLPCYLFAGGALRLLFRLVLPQGKTTGFDRTTSPKPTMQLPSGKTGVLSPTIFPLHRLLVNPTRIIHLYIENVYSHRTFPDENGDFPLKYCSLLTTR